MTTPPARDPHTTDSTAPPPRSPVGGDPTSRPLIVTALLDSQTTDFFDGLRRRHFPPERNFLAAHVTLFHQLPGHELESVDIDIARQVATRRRFDVEVSGLRLLGGGVAYDLVAPELTDLRAALATRWESMLTAQDRRRFAPHVTVQNKVAPSRARELHALLSATHGSMTARAEGVALWRYLGGPWEPVTRHLFGP